MSKTHWLIASIKRQITQQAKGPALLIAKGMIEQIPQFISAGMPVEMACRESLHLAIHSAQIKVRHCVGSERYALDDFIATCMKIETLTDHLVQV